MIGKFIVAMALALAVGTAAFVEDAGAARQFRGGGSGARSMHFRSSHFGGGHFGFGRFGGARFGSSRFAMHHFGGLNRFAFGHSFGASRFGRHSIGRYGAGARFGSNFARAGAAGAVGRESLGYRHGQFGQGRFGRNFVGWAGPVFWPYADDDLFDYAFWPYDAYGPYYDQFWAYGYDDLFAGVLLPYDYMGLYGGYGAAPPATGQAPPQPATPVAGSSAAQLCVRGAPAPGGVPTDLIAKAVQPNSDQRAKLDALKTAEAAAEKALADSCATQAPATSLGRLDAVQTRIQAMLRAADIVRTALGDFYSSLSDEQKASFNGLGGNPQAAKQGAAKPTSLAQLCGPQNAVPVISVEQIDKAVQPDAQQRAALAALSEAANKADETILASCPSQAPLTPPGRLDAVRARLQAMLNGLGIVRPALQSFYASLSDQQKSRFDSLTLPTATSQQNAKSP